MKEPAAKYWVWDLYPLSPGTCGNRQVPADDTPPGHLKNTSRNRPIGRVSYTFFDDPTHPLPVDTVWRWTCVLKPAALMRWYRGDVPDRPSWGTTKSELVVAGQRRDLNQSRESPVGCWPRDVCTLPWRSERLRRTRESITAMLPNVSQDTWDPVQTDPVGKLCRDNSSRRGRPAGDRCQHAPLALL